MKTGPAILFFLGCLGLAAGMLLGPTSHTGAAVGLGILALMTTAMFVVSWRRSDG